MDNRTIFITGISSGLGKALAQEALRAGYTVVGTVRTQQAKEGMFRTDWAGRSMQRVPRTIADYDVTFNPQREARAQRSGHQQGDPAKAAKAMLRILEEPNPPAHLLLGTDAVKYASDKLSAHLREIEDWRHLSETTDFDK